MLFLMPSVTSSTIDSAPSIALVCFSVAGSVFFSVVVVVVVAVVSFAPPLVPAVQEARLIAPMHRVRHKAIEIIVFFIFLLQRRKCGDFFVFGYRTKLE